MRTLIEGKTKIIKDRGDGTVDVLSKDIITAADGARSDPMEGKAASSTRTTCNLYEVLARRGVANHFVERIDATTFRARKVNMIPIELVARRIASGSYVDRFPEVALGTVFDELVFEMFEKDDDRHDPLIEFNFNNGTLFRYVPNVKAASEMGAEPGDLMSAQVLSISRYADVTLELVDQLRELTLRTFAILEELWASVGGTFTDLKIEAGFDDETRRLLLADVIDAEAGKLSFGDRDMSKQPYRDGSQSLSSIATNFEEVADFSDQFVQRS